MNNMEEITLDSINKQIDSKFENLINIFSLKLEDVTARLDLIDKKVEIIEKLLMKPMLSDDLRSIIKEKSDLTANKKIIVKLLNSKIIESDVKVFAEYYIIKYNEWTKCKLFITN